MIIFIIAIIPLLLIFYLTIKYNEEVFNNSKNYKNNILLLADNKILNKKEIFELGYYLGYLQQKDDFVKIKEIISKYNNINFSQHFSLLNIHLEMHQDKMPT